MNILEEILKTSDDSDNGYFLEIDSRYPDKVKTNKEAYDPPWKQNYSYR